MTREEVAVFLGVTLNTVKFHRANGTLPEPDRMYGRTPLWKESTIRAWDSKRDKRMYNRKG